MYVWSTASLCISKSSVDHIWAGSMLRSWCHVTSLTFIPIPWLCGCRKAAGSNRFSRGHTPGMFVDGVAVQAIGSQEQREYKLSQSPLLLFLENTLKAVKHQKQSLWETWRWMRSLEVSVSSRNTEHAYVDSGCCKYFERGKGRRNCTLREVWISFVMLMLCSIELSWNQANRRVRCLAEDKNDRCFYLWEGLSGQWYLHYQLEIEVGEPSLSHITDSFQPAPSGPVRNVSGVLQPPKLWGLRWMSPPQLLRQQRHRQDSHTQVSTQISTHAGIQPHVVALTHCCGHNTSTPKHTRNIKAEQFTTDILVPHYSLQDTQAQTRLWGLSMCHPSSSASSAAEVKHIKLICLFCQLWGLNLWPSVTDSDPAELYTTPLELIPQTHIFH